MIGRKIALWLTAATAVLGFVAPASTHALSGPDACNGAVELCNRPFNEVVLPGTHNSMSNEDYGWVIPNQFVSIPTQLDQGVRAFLIDTHYGKLKPGSGPSGVTDWNVGTDGDPVGTADTFLCHSSCNLGATGLVTELTKVANFLAANPREVLVFVNEDGIAPADFARAVSDSGLDDYLYKGSTSDYPTLGQMIASNQRVVMLAEGHSGSPPANPEMSWYHLAYEGSMQETPYDFRKNEAGNPLTTQGGIAQLTEPASLNSTCRPNRGGTTGALFLMNHWVNGKYDNSNGIVPDAEVAGILNAKEVIVNRARACETRRGMLPSIIAVDQFGAGNLIDAVNELNGVEPDPEPVPKGILLRLKAPKKVTVKAGKAAIFKLTVTNVGDRTGRVRVCASVPAKLARKPKCLTRSIKAGVATTLKIKVRSRPKASGKGKVTFTATAAGKSKRAGSTLVVKPARKRR